MGKILSAAMGRIGSNEKWRQGGARSAGGQGKNASWAALRRASARADGMHPPECAKKAWHVACTAVSSCKPQAISHKKKHAAFTLLFLAARNL
ncbi:hypothetical protein ACIOVF_07545 [Pseudomonas sp. NPDC087612]|uniref:hypothetical protein n=1 Tax=unclassified Pseudomonas TaxID=196821 RepID=UPI0015A676B9|nr:MULTISPECIES: hypothetical protein [unclassified Pseudomonas]QVM96378.1 hypothetical protein JYG36_25305 [Pseudomonas sp. SORT22]